MICGYCLRPFRPIKLLASLSSLPCNTFQGQTKFDPRQGLYVYLEWWLNRCLCVFVCACTKQLAVGDTTALGWRHCKDKDAFVVCLFEREKTNLLFWQGPSFIDSDHVQVESHLTTRLNFLHFGCFCLSAASKPTITLANKKLRIVLVLSHGLYWKLFKNQWSNKPTASRRKSDLLVVS